MSSIQAKPHALHQYLQKEIQQCQRNREEYSLINISHMKCTSQLCSVQYSACVAAEVSCIKWGIEEWDWSITIACEMQISFGRYCWLLILYFYIQFNGENNMTYLRAYSLICYFEWGKSKTIWILNPWETTQLQCTSTINTGRKHVGKRYHFINQSEWGAFRNEFSLRANINSGSILTVIFVSFCYISSSAPKCILRDLSFTNPNYVYQANTHNQSHLENISCRCSVSSTFHTTYLFHVTLSLSSIGSLASHCSGGTATMYYYLLLL